MALNLKCSPTSTADEKIISISNDKINLLENNIITGFLNILNMSWIVDTAQILNIDLPKNTKFEFDPATFLGESVYGVKFIAVVLENKVKAEKGVENEVLTLKMADGGGSDKIIPIGRLFVLTATKENPIPDTFTFYNGVYDSDDDTISDATNDVTLKMVVGA
jgi:hypothetical protein